MSSFSPPSPARSCGSASTTSSTSATRFRCVTTNTRNLISLLSSLSAFTPSESKKKKPDVGQTSRFNASCGVYISSTGITFLVSGLVKTSQASVNLQSELFDVYDLPGDPTDDSVGHDFTLDINVLLSSLQILGPAYEQIGCEFTYDDESKIFKTQLTDRNGVICKTAIQTSADDMEDDSLLQSTFIASPVVCRAIIKSAVLKQSYDEINRNIGSTKVEFSVSPHAIIISCEGDNGATYLDMPRSRSIFSSLETHPPTKHTRTYSKAYLSDGMRGCDVASETCIQINKDGVLAIQHQVVDNKARSCYVDFILAPLQDESDEYESNSVSTTQDSNSQSQQTSQDTDEEEGFRRRGGKHRAQSASPLKSYAPQQNNGAYEDDSDESTEDEYDH
ncbi:hypothetical protein TrVE_jg7018 [Triparma verrucosa]|uniref:Cell cycle checkpoint protein RAD1 n=1 Tax=Triparma verrucosa TaxID=1606542 RepID=A0A9W7C6E9_9STRA|nr:hypothetical protein TrVE_jg7018 [Triparma verrucosa]